MVRTMAAEHIVNVYGTAVMICTPEGIPLDTEGVATELIGEAISLRSEIVVIPAERMTDDFFELSTGVAGEITQKFANYRIRLAVIGDIEARLAANESLGSWVAEANRGTEVWFCPTFDDFIVRLDRRSKPR